MNASSGIKMPGGAISVQNKQITEPGQEQATAAGEADDNAATGQAVDENALMKSAKFDPSKFISEDFLQILNEHRKNCEREGKLQ